METGSKIKFALLLTGLSSLFLMADKLDGDGWIGFQQWIYTAFALANVAAPFMHRGKGAPAKD